MSHYILVLINLVILAMYLEMGLVSLIKLTNWLLSWTSDYTPWLASLDGRGRLPNYQTNMSTCQQQTLFHSIFHIEEEMFMGISCLLPYVITKNVVLTFFSLKAWSAFKVSQYMGSLLDKLTLWCDLRTKLWIEVIWIMLWNMLFQTWIWILYKF